MSNKIIGTALDEYFGKNLLEFNKNGQFLHILIEINFIIIILYCRIDFQAMIELVDHKYFYCSHLSPMDSGC